MKYMYQQEIALGDQKTPPAKKLPYATFRLM